ncbi:M48 family metallopeptidase [Anabaenopsis tanganyikae CS-531]|uniref:M48 family metallopeptidase n=2 Tax=Anabaenopsis TaxID=110103 RepID=A0ABT5AMB8_9CYAN|nr:MULTISPECIES: M48 family metallopeptidase [Anabaenopsis]MDB9538439.1 M48 family metallopeptidase [Anabaenopsis arnoldii]MDH6090706.1 M48 family metallopeptidase [Anabaenopsis arnoldii]MDH6105010.1 M48 family metallopeptidase [Anabaenopsis tanganyikae CS-531]
MKKKPLLWVACGIFLFLCLHLTIPIISTAQTPNVANRLQTLVKADQLYLAGDTAGAEKLYRQVKTPFAQEASRITLPEPITDPEQLSGAGRVYWRNATEGMQQGLTSKIFVPLQMLLERHPEFTPAYTLYAEATKKYGDKKDILPVLERAISIFPQSAELNQALIKAQQEAEQWLEASITARQFAMTYPDHPQAEEFTSIAENNFNRFRSQLNQQVVLQGIVGATIGIVTGNANLQAVTLAPLLLQGESAMGAQLAAVYKQQSTLIEDPTIVEYVSRIGNNIANLMGRNDFDYEFNVILDDSLNAFALPGGKVFVNTGAIMALNSEAELAGLLGHEVGHAVLSHGFDRITNANLLANVGQIIPFGNLISNLAILDYGRQQETQADVVGTRVLAGAGYAADGLRNFFVTIKQQEKGRTIPAYLSTHPASEDRMRYLEEIIQRNGYNRYAFEGVQTHKEIQARLEQILEESKQQEDEIVQE